MTMTTKLIQTASQTIGPFFHFSLIEAGQNNLLQERTRGTRILLHGFVFDGDGQAVPDAMLEIWQADANGFYNHPADVEHAKADPHFQGFGRCATDANGAYRFQTVKPGARDGVPYINVRIWLRGLLIHVVTRIYFSDELENENDPVLAALEPHRQNTLIASRLEVENSVTYRFDIHMQGDLETVFFDV
jgi:protocatechuate 3,4-dioxygenase, alpha subunit